MPIPIEDYGLIGDTHTAALMAPVGFLPATDERIQGTVAAIGKQLCPDGYVRRYSTGAGLDGLPGGEGAFLPRTFWLADNHRAAPSD